MGVEQKSELEVNERANAQEVVMSNEKKSETKKAKTLTYKVSEKGAVSVYGLQRFPVTLYAEQWDALLCPDNVAALRTFVDLNRERLTKK